MTEDYIRPPIVALERPSHTAAVWRFRIVVLVLLAGIAVGAFFIARAIINSGENSNPQGFPHRPLTAARQLR
jgi:hypothetical protein